MSQFSTLVSRKFSFLVASLPLFHWMITISSVTFTKFLLSENLCNGTILVSTSARLSYVCIFINSTNFFSVTLSYKMEFHINMLCSIIMLRVPRQMYCPLVITVHHYSSLSISQLLDQNFRPHALLDSLYRNYVFSFCWWQGYYFKYISFPASSSPN